MSRGIEHRDVGNELTKQEWLEGAHYFMSGTSFPSSPSEAMYSIDLMNIACISTTALLGSH